MKYFFTLACTFIFTQLTYGGSFPTQFRCRPVQWYSGGYRIFEVKYAVGYTYLQRTSGHGLEIGPPLLESTIPIQAKAVEGKIEFQGFQAWDGARESLRFPLDWDGMRIVVASPLFDNDFKSDGVCKAIETSLQ